MWIYHHTPVWESCCRLFLKGAAARPWLRWQNIDCCFQLPKLRKIRHLFSTRAVLGGRFALSSGKLWFRVLVGPNSEPLDWAGILRRQRWATGCESMEKSVFALEGRFPESTIHRKQVWCFNCYNCFFLLAKTLSSNEWKCRVWALRIPWEGEALAMSPCSFARAGVAEPGCCPVTSPSLGHGTAPPALSHRRTLSFCMQHVQPPAASSLEGKGPVPQRFLLLGLGRGSGETELRESLTPHGQTWPGC